MGEVTREVVDVVRGIAGAIDIDPTPQEVPWSTPLDEDNEHATYDPNQVASYTHPAPDGFAAATLSPPQARWEEALGEYVLDWDAVRSCPNPHELALEFARSALRHFCEVCEWDPALADSAEGTPPPVA